MDQFESEQLFDIIEAIEKHNSLNWGLTLSYKSDGWHCELSIDGDWRRKSFLNDGYGMKRLKERITECEKWDN